MKGNDHQASTCSWILWDLVRLNLLRSSNPASFLPHKHDADSITPGERLADYHQWSNAGVMPREEAIKFVEDWRNRNA